jgi:hypothetical protein
MDEIITCENCDNEADPNFVYRPECSLDMLMCGECFAGHASECGICCD